MRRTIALVEKTPLEMALDKNTGTEAVGFAQMTAVVSDAGAQPSGARCKACQLQLCKSRDERPHAALSASPVAQTTGRDKSRSPADTAFVCKTCGITMIHSADLARPGWRQAR